MKKKAGIAVAVVVVAAGAGVGIWHHLGDLVDCSANIPVWWSHRRQKRFS